VFDTRCVTVAFPDGRQLTCLVPCADMCNHHPNAQLSKPAYSDERGGCLQFKTLCSIEKGDQIFLNYGALNNLHLLVYYGFTAIDNPYDSVTLELEPPEVKSIPHFKHRNVKKKTKSVRPKTVSAMS